MPKFDCEGREAACQRDPGPGITSSDVNAYSIALSPVAGMLSSCLRLILNVNWDDQQQGRILGWILDLCISALSLNQKVNNLFQ